MPLGARDLHLKVEAARCDSFTGLKACATGGARLTTRYLTNTLLRLLAGRLSGALATDERAAERRGMR